MPSARGLLLSLRMNEPLVPDVSHLKTAASFAACLAIGGITVYAALPDAPKPTTTVIHHHDRVPVPVTVPMVTMVPRVEAAPVAAPVRSHALQFVVHAGKETYLKLATVGDGAEAMPVHGEARLVDTEGTSATTVASVTTADVPLAYRTWLGKKVIVDGTCTATVTGFALLSRLVGDPGYAGEGNESKWMPASVLEHGGGMLAAKLDNCTGTYARDAALPPVVVPVVIHDDGLANEAKAAVIASPAAAEAQTEWTSSWERHDHWWDTVGFTTTVVRHPVTGETWVITQAHDTELCGNPNVNVMGMFRVEADGKLVPVAIRNHFELDAVHQLIDVDGDGQPEILGAPWLGTEQTLETADGTELESLELPFYGCPC